MGQPRPHLQQARARPHLLRPQQVRVRPLRVQAQHRHQHQRVVRPAQAQVAQARQQQWLKIYELR